MLCQICLKSKWRGRWCEFLVWSNCAMTTADEENEVQENVITSLSRNSNSECSLTGIVKHVEGNMSRGHEYIFHCLNIVNSYNLFQPHTPLFQSKPSPTVNYNEGLCNIFPQKEQRKPSKVKIRLLTFPILSATFSVCPTASHRLPNEWSLTAKLYFRNDQKTHFGVNTWLTQADHKVSKLCCHSVFPHVVPRP